VPELALVACEDERIAGSIVYSLAKVVDGKGAAIEALCLGPVSVAPGERKKGIGSQLINESLAKAEDLGHRGVFLFGNPAYYGRFGFLDAKTYGVTTSSGENFDAFMGLELYRDSLKGVSGKLVCDSAFEVDKEALELYDKSFPPREKHKTDSQIFKE
jgi:predicted N-acetyltransferase YhbS